MLIRSQGRVHGRVPGRVQRLYAIAAGAAGGLLVALSLPPFGWWPLGLAGLGLVAFVLPGQSWKRRMLIGVSFGVCDYLVGLWWVQEFSVPGYLGLVVLSTVYIMLALLLVPARSRWSVALALPAVLVLADWARDRFPLGGFPLGGVSLGQTTGPLVPVLRLGGSLLLTAEAALVGVFLAMLAGATLRRQGPRGLPVIAGLLVLTVTLPVAGWLSPSGAGGHLPSIRVALVQGGGPRGTRAVSTDPALVFDRHIAASSEVTGPVDLVVWPEGVLESSGPYQDSPQAASVAALAERLHATVVAGVDQDLPVNRYLNEVVAWAPNGRVVATYVKNHLVPFGEYIPDRSLIDRLFNVSDVPYDAIAGHSSGLMWTPAGPLGLMISYEVFFDSRVRSAVRAGGQILVVPTNTASYRSTQVPTQEVAADRMRAWETGRWLVQVTPTGYTTVVSPTGDVVRQSRLDARQIVTAVVPRLDGSTVFDTVGELPVLVLAIVLLAGAWAFDNRVTVLSRRRFRPIVTVTDIGP